MSATNAKSRFSTFSTNQKSTIRLTRVITHNILQRTISRCRRTTPTRNLTMITRPTNEQYGTKGRLPGGIKSPAAHTTLLSSLLFISRLSQTQSQNGTHFATNHKGSHNLSIRNIKLLFNIVNPTINARTARR